MNASLRNLLAAGVGAAAALAIALPLVPAGATTTTTEITTQMDGQQEVPPADANGTGDAFFFFPANDPRALCYVLIVDQIRPATVAHIHRGGVGVVGPPVVDLRAPSDGDSAACVQTRLADNIVANPARFYVNVHNRRFPDGAIRGQLG
jgi:CHRD domain